jgi:membrane protease YdiL (CAAX protease family)
MLAGALAVRVGVAGPTGPASLRAGLVFAAILGTVAAAAHTNSVFDARVGLDVRALFFGVGGVIALGLPAVATRGFADVHPAGSFVTWGVATAVVATAEEAFLRGALFGAVERWRGTNAAVVVAAVAFALMHVPLYGWHVVPLDLAVGVMLGALRVLTGGWAAPAVAHVGADLVGWWTV